MRRSLYQKTFLKSSALYRGETERRPSTLPPHMRLKTMTDTRPLATSLDVPQVARLEMRSRPPPRYSCSDATGAKVIADVFSRRPYRPSIGGPSSDFPLRIKKDLSSDTFGRSLDSESSNGYVSPRSHRSYSNQADNFENDVFSRHSSNSDENERTSHLCSAGARQESIDTTDETWKTCTSAEEYQYDPMNESTDGYDRKTSISWENSIESESSFGQSVIDITKGEGYNFAIKQFDSFDKLCKINLDDNDDELCKESTGIKQLNQHPFSWSANYADDFDEEHLAKNREDNSFAFKIDYSDPNEDQPNELKEHYTFQQGLFPGRKKSQTLEGLKESTDGDRDEGFDSPVYSSRDADELGDLFASRQELTRREAFRKERSLDSDETSGFISKHSSETTDLSSRLSSTQFTTKHMSEPLGLGSAGSTSEMPRQQHLSEPSDMVQVDSVPKQKLPDSDFMPRRLLSVEVDLENRIPGAISRKRELFRKSKRLKHFNLRRIDDTDNDSSCDAERLRASSEEAAEPPSTRLKEEVGLPKHLSRDGSVDHYGLYKSRSEKTITSFESDRGGQGRLHDFESFLEAVTFPQRLQDARQKAASADEMELSDLETIAASQATSHRRKSRSKRDLTRRLKCLLL